MIQPKKLQGQVAIVTGASSGIGAGVAKALSEAGAIVIVNYASSPEKAEAVLNEIKAKGGEGFTVKADVSNEADVMDMFQQTIKRANLAFSYATPVLEKQLLFLIARI